jgi:hypothetical protein
VVDGYSPGGWRRVAPASLAVKRQSRDVAQQLTGEDADATILSMATNLTISASRVAALLGQSKFQSRMALYHELTGDAPPRDDNELLAEGREFEDAIARIACKKFGLTLVTDFSGAPFAPHITHGVLSGHPDRIVIDNDGKLCVLEVKNTLFADHENEEQGWGQPGTDQVPAAYWCQCQVYAHLLHHADLSPLAAAIRALPIADYCLLAVRLRSGVQLYRIPLDKAFIETVEIKASEMLARVDLRMPPDPMEPSEFRARWLPVPKKAVEATAEIAAVVAQHVELGKQIRAMEKERENLAALILGFAQDASVINWQGKSIGTVGANREFDVQRFLAEQGSIAAHFMKLDVTAVKKAYAAICDTYMREPENAAQAKRVLRLKGGDA